MILAGWATLEEQEPREDISKEDISKEYIRKKTRHGRGRGGNRRVPILPATVCLAP